MAKDPAFLFYPNDWSGGTMTMTRQMKGCYIDLLLAQFNNGPLHLEEIKVVLGADFNVWPVLAKKFKQDENGLFYNARLLSEQTKRSEFSKKQKDRIKTYWDGKNTTEQTTELTNEYTTVLPLENENENRNKIENVIKILNEITGSSFRKNSKASNRHISARLNEGFTIPDFKQVIETKFYLWHSDPRMAPYIRPETLFGTKFEGYLEESKKYINGSIKPQQNGITDKQTRAASRQAVVDAARTTLAGNNSGQP